MDCLGIANFLYIYGNTYIGNSAENKIFDTLVFSGNYVKESGFLGVINKMG